MTAIIATGRLERAAEQRVAKLKALLGDIDRLAADPAAGDLARLAPFKELAQLGYLQNYEPLLPVLLRLKGKPYSLVDHPQFVPAFSIAQPESTLWITGRQVTKTSSIASSGVIAAASRPPTDPLRRPALRADPPHFQRLRPALHRAVPDPLTSR